MEMDGFMKHFQHLGKMLSYLCWFMYKIEVSESPTGHHIYKWSMALFFSNLFVHGFLYFYTYYNFYSNTPLEISHLTKFVVSYSYAGLRFALAFLEKDRFTDLVFEIQMYDVQKQVLFYQHKSLHKNYYGKLVAMTLSFIIMFLLFYYSVGVFSSYKFMKRSDMVYFYIAIVVLTFSSLPFTVLFVYFAYEIFLRYENLHKHFIHELNSVNKNYQEKFLDNYRLLYFQLSRAQHKFNVYFGSGTIIFYCCTYFLLLCHMRDALEVIHYPLILFLIAKVLFETYLIGHFAENIKKESNSMLNVLCSLPTTNLSVRSQSQVHLFIIQFLISDKGVSAAKHFNISKATIISMLTCVTAYFPLLVSVITYGPIQGSQS